MSIKVWAFLRHFLRKTHNKDVYHWFRDVDDRELIEALGNARQSAKAACLIGAKDSINFAILKMFMFWYIAQKIQNKPDVYGIPVSSFQEQRKFQPQIILHFLQDSDRVLPDNAPVTGQISFRLMDETSTSISSSQVAALALKVKSKFGNSGGFLWAKGRKMVTYNRWDQGYALQLRCWNEAEGKRVIEQVLDIQGHSPDWKYSNVTENQEELQRYPLSPGTQLILGETVKKPRERPVADVRFTHAELHLHGRKKPVILYDRTFRHVGAIETD